MGAFGEGPPQPSYAPSHPLGPIISQITTVITSSIRPPPSTTTSSSGSSLPAGSGGQGSVWERISTGAKVAIIIAIILGVIVIVIFSLLFCCGCCCWKSPLSSVGRRNIAEETGRAVPLENVAPDTTHAGITPVEAPAQRRLSLRRRPRDAPPSYEEAVPASHQQLAIGEPISPVPEEDASNIVVDGKTPLSEIPFEDVDVNALGGPSSSASASSAAVSASEVRLFHDAHHNQAGDTTGHTSA
ncbi:hypothetical protein F5884DRAFT_745214 [Xylogone sp. PMI_703]|nr:hypothetical protein F5884DRAFT_745214 [Xylogone sp. PMI_703]